MPVAIAGLAYHPIADVLIVTTNLDPDMIYFVNATTHATIAQFAHPAIGSYRGAGCELDLDGNLWVVSQKENKMYLVETGLGLISAEWLSWEPREGSVSAGGTGSIDVTVKTRILDPGAHRGNIVLATNDVNNPLIIVPVTVQVTQPPIITEATAEPTLGEPPLKSDSMHRSMHRRRQLCASAGTSETDRLLPNWMQSTPIQNQVYTRLHSKLKMNWVQL